MKVTVVGAGAVGASCAEYIAIKDFASEVVLVDIKENFAEGKAMDLMQTASLNGFDTKITGSTNDYSKTAGSDIAVITSGIPRKPGMTREELIGINAGIVKMVSENLIKHSPDVILIIVSIILKIKFDNWLIIVLFNFIQHLARISIHVHKLIILIIKFESLRH